MQRINTESNNGPNITPQKPNNVRPIITPNTVINGCVSAIFFCNIKRIRLSELDITIRAYIAKPMALNQSPVSAK